jgi:predicted O-methyltransferase YrrM
MYSTFQLIKKYLRYRITASNGKGHGVHSPFVYHFIEQVLNDKKEYPFYKKAEQRRNELLRDHHMIEVEDFGAGSALIKTRQRKVSAIAASSLKPRKYAQLLYRIVQQYQPGMILELGTSLGTSTAYMAAANPAAKVYTCEGSENIAVIARYTFQKLDVANIETVTGNFDDTLPVLLSRCDHVDLAFIDGNHRKVPTLDYFEKILPKLSQQGMIIFDDIHWSAEMEEAWHRIKQHPSVTLSIDLFFIGIILISPDFKERQHFVINY